MRGMFINVYYYTNQTLCKCYLPYYANFPPSCNRH